MKARAILLASVLLVGCQASKHDDTVEQRAQSLSAAGQGEAGKFTSQARWLDDGTFYAQDQDLWTSIGDELKMGIPDNPRIREQKQKYLRNKSYLHDVTLRAEPYMYWIAGQVKKRNMPMELVLLPIVESAFDPHATSGANAAGIWQIIPSTGRNYGLKQTRSYDARRDVVVSTTAALDMMQRLNKMFDGDWLLTVAAYNSGEGRVMKAVKANRSRGKPTDFWSLSLPHETKIYVPKMLALSDILKNSKRYGVKLPTADESRALARVRLDSPVDISQLADMAGMPVSKLKTFNAGVKGSTLGASGPKYVMVPQKHAAQLRESLASGDIAAVQPTQLADNTPLTSRSYKVRSGDTISGIASRLGVTTRDLQQWNNLRGSGLKVGQNLVIGAGSSAQRLANNSDSITYRVRKGDSLSSIAKRHGVNIRDVMRWNSDTDNPAPRRSANVVCEKQRSTRVLIPLVRQKGTDFPGAFFIA
ncbi:membrane-bound lytic murein transglycosylase D [Klebsiella pneumoniae subsp. rhinoscleromatis]|nr:membrane-bound lytic murein transglycosylase D [Klebsiella pneumoniae subsp. rhinoscleromatis]